MKQQMLLKNSFTKWSTTLTKSVLKFSEYHLVLKQLLEEHIILIFEKIGKLDKLDIAD